ncbi:hypothetical protein D3C81_2059200 [compost metagenome]
MLEQFLQLALVNPGAGTCHVILQGAQLGHGGFHQGDPLIRLVVGAGHFAQGHLDAVLILGHLPVFGLGGTGCQHQRQPTQHSHSMQRTHSFIPYC